MEKRQSYTSSPVRDKRSWKQTPHMQRYYATPDCDNGLPVFTTPTSMYINPTLNPTYASPPQKYAPTPQQQPKQAYTPRFDTPPLFRPTPSASTQYTRERTASIDTDKDRNKYATSPENMLVNQLVEMGFNREKAKKAVADKGSLQEAIDILLLDTRQEKQLPPEQPVKDKVRADEERRQGNYLFNKGLFTEAEAAYTHAIHSLPAQEAGLILLNRAATRLKLGKYKECIRDCDRSLALGGAKTQRLKALRRKGSALEYLNQYNQAIPVYQEYLTLENDPHIQQSLIRCQNQGSAFPEIDFNLFIDNDEVGKSKAVQEMRAREKKKEEEEAEKLKKTDKVNAQLDQWKSGKERNLRSLLSTLEIILWEDVVWTPVLMKDLLDPRKCKVTYMKAIAKVHPDKLSSSATVEQRMLANGIFTTLNQAWDIFKAENAF